MYHYPATKRYNRAVVITEAISNPLYWDDAYPIALLLKARYPDVEPVEIDQATLREWVMALPGFNDDPAVVCAEWLDDIRREWLEIGGVR